MARKTGSTISQEELFLQSDEPVRPPVAEDLDDARMLDLDVEQESPFLRGQKRVSVRRGSLPKKTFSVVRSRHNDRNSLRNSGRGSLSLW
jgi:hypothetical protein